MNATVLTTKTEEVKYNPGFVLEVMCGLYAECVVRAETAILAPGQENRPGKYFSPLRTPNERYWARLVISLPDNVVRRRAIFTIYDPGRPYNGRAFPLDKDGYEYMTLYGIEWQDTTKSPEIGLVFLKPSLMFDVANINEDWFGPCIHILKRAYELCKV